MGPPAQASCPAQPRWTRGPASASPSPQRAAEGLAGSLVDMDWVPAVGREARVALVPGWDLDGEPGGCAWAGAGEGEEAGAQVQPGLGVPQDVVPTAAPGMRCLCRWEGSRAPHPIVTVTSWESWGQTSLGLGLWLRPWAWGVGMQGRTPGDRGCSCLWAQSVPSYMGDSRLGLDL